MYSKVLRDTVLCHKIQIALYQRHEVVKCEITDIVSGRVDILVRQELLLVCDIAGICGLDLHGVWGIGNTLEYNDLAGISLKLTAYTCCTYLLSLIDVGL